jgi:hypothetical protein
VNIVTRACELLDIPDLLHRIDTFAGNLDRGAPVGVA